MITKKGILTALFGIIVLSVTAQDKFFTKNGRIAFVSKGVLETNSAEHKGVTAVLDAKSGQLQFSVQMRGFEFKKALMQEHFNENYVESNKFPRSTFTGQVSNNSDIKYQTDGVYNATVKGTLTLHGESRPVEASGKITVKGGKPQLQSDFTIQLSDYKIGIPSMVKEKVNNTVNVTVDCALEPLKS